MPGRVLVRCRLPGRLPLGACHAFTSDPKIPLLVISTGEKSWLVNAERFRLAQKMKRDHKMKATTSYGKTLRNLPALELLRLVNW